MTDPPQTTFAGIPFGRILDLLSTWRHAPYLTRHRLSAIDTRIRVVALALALVTLLWIAFDAATLTTRLWQFLAICRVVAVLIFIRLVIAPARESSRMRALTLLGIVLALLLTLYGVSQFLLAGVPLTGLAAVNGNLYRALPLVVLAVLSIFPLASSEGLFFAAVIAAVVATIQRVLGEINLVDMVSALWVFVLVMGVYLIGCAIQLNYMMTLAHRANHDASTGALTHHSGVEVLDLHFRLSCVRDLPLSVLFIGVEPAKSAGSRSGDGAPDLMLKELVTRLHALLRLSDVVIRWGREELVVILANTPMAGARLVVERHSEKLLAAPPGGVHNPAALGIAERQADGADDWWTLIALSSKRMLAERTAGDSNRQTD